MKEEKKLTDHFSLCLVDMRCEINSPLFRTEAKTNYKIFRFVIFCQGHTGANYHTEVLILIIARPNWRVMRQNFTTTTGATNRGKYNISGLKFLEVLYEQ